jgi:long-chain acyl-CoA synthetase
LSPLHEAVEAVAAHDPDRPALVDAGGRRSYGELARLLAQAAAEPPAPARTVLPARTCRADAERILLVAARDGSTLVLDGAATAWETSRAGSVFVSEPPSLRPVLGLCTSGTSGLPRVVDLDWATVLHNAAAFADAARYDADVVWVTTPLAHLYGLGAGTVAGLLRGCTVLLASGAVGPREFTDRLRDDGVTVLLSVPFLLRRYLGELEREPASGHRLRLALAAGEPVGDVLVEAWRLATGTPLLSHYGLTEGGHVTLAHGAPGEGVGPPLAGIDVRVEPDGELSVRQRPPVVSHRIAGEPGPPGGWRRTGDRGFIDERGNLHVAGRIGDRINVAGRKVDPVEVERALRTHPAVRDCAIAGARGADGERVVAFVDSAGALDPALLRAHLLETLSAYKLPARFVAVESIPRTLTGKVRRGELLAGLDSAPERSPAPAT